MTFTGLKNIGMTAWTFIRIDAVAYFSTCCTRLCSRTRCITVLAPLIIVVAAMLVASCSADEQQLAPSIRIVAYGIFEHDRVAMRVDETSSVGAKRGHAQGLRVAVQTDRIPLRPGLSYGIAFRVTGVPAHEVRIRAVLRSSNACVLKSSGDVVYHNDSVLTVKVGELRHIGARIPASEDEDHCVGASQPGTDTFELYLGYQKLAEKTFRIYRES